MANFGPEPIKYTFKAASDLSAAQFKFVKMTANNTVDLCSSATDKPIGVLLNSPASGQQAAVLISGVTKVVGSAALSAGAQIGTTASGTAVALVAGTDTTKYVVGTVLDGSANANEIVTAAIDCSSPNRAA